MPLRVVRRHGSPHWYIRGTVAGKALDESTGVADQSQAEAIRAKREWEIVRQEIGGRRASATFLEAAVSYMQSGGEKRFVAPILRYFGDRKLSDIGQAEIEECARKLYPGRRPSTVTRQVFSPISAIICHAAGRQMCERPTIKRPKQPRGRVRAIGYAEAERLIAACAPHLAPIVEFLLFTGCRVGEALSLDWEDVDLTRAHVILHETKNGDRRGVPLHPRVVALLANRPHRTGPVFRTDRRHGGLGYTPRALGGNGIGKAFATACSKAGIKDFRPHDCRHTWATWHYAENRDVRVLQELGGWKTMSMVQRYTHVSASHLASSVMRIGGGLGRNPGTIENGDRQMSDRKR